MTTSETTNYSETRTQIIESMYEIIGVKSIGFELTTEDSTKASNALNRMLAHWNVSGPHLWKYDEGILFLQPHQNKYKIGNAASDDMACLKDDLVLTQINGALAAGVATLVVDSTAGMTANDYIGVVLADKTVQWTTIDSITNATTLVLDAVLSGAVSDNAYIYTFTNKLYKPFEIFKKTCRCITGIRSSTLSTLQANYMKDFNYREFQSFVDVDSTPQPTLSGYNYLPQNTNGIFWAYPTPSDGAYRIQFSFKKQLEDMIDSSDTLDLPKEWLEPIVWQLAVRMIPVYSKFERAEYVNGIASSMLKNLKSSDQEFGDIQFTPGEDW